MKKLFCACFLAFLLTGCVTTEQTHDEKIVSIIERERNFKPMRLFDVDETKMVTYSDNMSMDEKEKLMYQSLNKARRMDNELAVKCLPPKIETFEQTQGTNSEKYNAAMISYVKCASKLGYNVEYSLENLTTTIKKK